MYFIPSQSTESKWQIVEEMQEKKCLADVQNNLIYLEW